MKFRKKPVVVEAIKFTDLSSINRMCNIWQKPFIDAADFDPNEDLDNFWIETLEGQHTATRGDWIIKGIAGEFYVCKNEIFQKTYEPVKDEV